MKIKTNDFTYGGNIKMVEEYKYLVMEDDDSDDDSDEDSDDE